MEDKRVGVCLASRESLPFVGVLWRGKSSWLGDMAG